MIEIRQVKTSRDLTRFIAFPFRLYKGNPYWCPRIWLDERRTLDKKKNAAFKNCLAEYWLAYKDGVPAGRIAGIINPKANGRWNEDLVRFGWIDFIDDPEVSGKLIETVEEWGRSKGMKGIHGPLGFTDMDNEGMLVEGFEELCNLSSIYNYPYYVEHMQRHGFSKAADWVQYEFPIPTVIPEKVDRIANIVLEKFHLRSFKARKAKGLRPYTRKLFVMVNEAFDDLYGYSALSDEQMDAYTKQYFGFIRPEFISLILDEKDEIIGFAITMPSLTKALQKCDGRIFPFGFIHLLKALRTNDIVDMYLVGVRPDYHGKGVPALIWRDLQVEYNRYGVRVAISNPQLEDNAKALTIWKNYEHRKIMQRRCWIKHW